MSTPDGEHLAIDIAFPAGNSAKGIVFVLHGLNGGSGEPFICDFVSRCTSEGMIAIVMIARGLMGTSVYSGQMFHGGRTSDIDHLIQSVHRLLPSVPLFGVGFSMGGIILSNYVAKSGKSCPLLGAVSVSGSGNSKINMVYEYSVKVWQPFLAYSLKENFLVPYYDFLLSRKIPLRPIIHSESVVDFDRALVTPLNGYKDVRDYYSDMSFGCKKKYRGVVTPLLILIAAGRDSNKMGHISTS
jgi:abhydrolase domain-containing protein 1/3